MVHKRRTKKLTTSLSSSSTFQTTSTNAAKATLTKASKCTKVSPTGTPLLAAFSTDTPDGSAFLGYVAPKGSAAKLSAVSILNGTTNQTYLILPNRAATNFDFVTPEGLIFSVDNKLLVKNKPLQSCSDPPSAAPARKRDIGNEMEERQVIGPLKGGATVAIDVSNHCGQPVTGLSPSPGAGTLHLLFTCDLAPYQYLGMGIYPTDRYCTNRLIRVSCSGCHTLQIWPTSRTFARSLYRILPISALHRLVKTISLHQWYSCNKSILRCDRSLGSYAVWHRAGS